MKGKYTVALSMVAGVAIGGLTVHGLHAQGCKPSYSVSEVKIINHDAERAYTALARNTIGNNAGKSLRTIAGRVAKIEGAEPPTNVAIVEWPSLDAALKFYKSEGWNKLQPERDKALPRDR